MYFYQVNINLSIASASHAGGIAEVITQAALDLTTKFGAGQWSATATERGVRNTMLGKSKVLIAQSDQQVVGTLRLTTTKPWVIEPSYFTIVEHPVYLVDMAIRPGFQRMGVGKSLIEAAKDVAAAWPGDCLRLDAYEGMAGAGGFYTKCGFTQRGTILYKNVPHIYFEWLKPVATTI